MSAATLAPAASAAEASRPASWLGAALLVLLLAAAAAMALRWPVPERAGGLSAAEVAEGPEALRRALARHLERNPRDGRGWVLFAMMEFEADRFESAAAAFERGIAASTKVASDPAVWCEYADALGMAQGGSLAGRPTELIERALSLQANHPKALEMAGSAAFERRDFAAAVTHWRHLLPQLPEGSQMHGELSTAIERAERLAATSLKP